MIPLVSFGYLHSDPPAADITVDVRRTLSDPGALSHRLRQSTGLDLAVHAVVMQTPGAKRLVEWLLSLLLSDDVTPALTVAIGCAGGRHRSVALVEEVARLLRQRGRSAMVQHRDVHLPVVQPLGYTSQDRVV